MTDTDRSVALLAALNESVLDLLEDSVVYVWRRHLLAALGRRLDADVSTGDSAVGFADLSGFTKLSQRVSVDRLAELVDEFENTAFDAVAAHGGRAVKLIGDEVMFVADSLPEAVDIGLDIAERLGAIDDMPPIHCGIAYGPTVSVGGDVFGPTANLAARLTTIARAGTLVIPRAAAAELRGRDDIEIVGVRRSFDLRGIGLTRVVTVRRASRSSTSLA
jgi:adenylate cyclase